VISLPVAHTDEFQDQCPWCEQPIPHEKFTEITDRLAAEEKARTAALTAELKGEFTQQLFAAQVAARLEGQQVAEASMAPTLAAEQQARHAAEDQLAAQKANEEHAVAARVAEAQQKLDADKAALEVTLATETKARETVEQQLAVQKANQDAVLETRLTEVRVALGEAHRKETATSQALAFKEQQALLKQVDDLKRKLEKKTNDELGEGAEIVLFDALRTAFPGDDIQRVKKGTEGADTLHRILEKGQPCGTIIYDSKNRNAWRNDYVVQLRKDQLAAKAEHAILVTRVFPSGCRQLSVRDGVILANPARVVALVEVLRTQTVYIAGLRLSEEAREEKMASLYDFITSDRCRQLFEQMEQLTDDMLDLDVKEKKAHDKVWESRGQLVRSSGQTMAVLASEIARIIQTPSVVELRQAR
jgi:hypothetical protein